MIGIRVALRTAYQSFVTLPKDISALLGQLERQSQEARNIVAACHARDEALASALDDLALNR